MCCLKFGWRCLGMVLWGTIIGVAVAGCAAGSPEALADIRYDLGPSARPLSSADRMGVIKMLDVSAPDMLSSDHLIYRLAYVDARRFSSYANSRWTASPAQLLTARLRSTLAARGTVLERSDSAPAPVLKIELEEFEQVFDGPAESHGAVTARATLSRDGKVLGQRTFVARAPASTQDAAGAAFALAMASDALVAQLAAWLGVHVHTDQ